MKISGNLINAYCICPRKAWLYSRAMNPYSEFDNLAIGRMISEDSYQRQKKEIEFENLKFDLVKSSAGTVVIGEVKKSSKGLDAARRQVLYYLFRLKEAGVEAEGEVLVPKERKKETVVLTPESEEELKNDIAGIEKVIKEDLPPALKKTGFCKKCAYNEFCWAEVEE